MGNKKHRKPVTKKEQAGFDNYARILQMVALLSLVILTVVDAYEPVFEVPIWTTTGILGIAIGLSPKEFVSIIKDFFRGRR